MRCGCPQCGSFMIHSDRDNACVCPDCLYRCYACQGTGAALFHEAVLGMKRGFPATTEERMRREKENEARDREDYAQEE